MMSGLVARNKATSVVATYIYKPISTRNGARDVLQWFEDVAWPSMEKHRSREYNLKADVTSYETIISVAL